MVFASGTKTFFLYKRIEGRPDKIKLGRFPEMSIEQARKAAYSTINDIAQGLNPKKEKAKIDKEILFDALFNEYMNKHSKLHKKRWKDDEDKYRLHFSYLGKRRISSIQKSDIIELHAKIVDKSGIYAANRVLALLSNIFTQAIIFGWEGINPCIGVKKFKEKSRERFLQGDEIPKFFKALNEEQSEVFRDFFYICLLTGARRNNVQTMKWQDINFERFEWFIKDTKNGESQIIPLSEQAVNILTQRFKIKTNEWVFPSNTSSSGHIQEPKKA